MPQVHPVFYRFLGQFGPHPSHALSDRAFPVQEKGQFVYYLSEVNFQNNDLILKKISRNRQNKGKTFQFWRWIDARTNVIINLLGLLYYKIQIILI